MKSILMSIQPYWGFLIIATLKGWDLAKYGLHEKMVEVRKGVPTSPDWDKKAALYFSKEKKSLARIPEEYRGEVAKLCGTVVGEFICDKVIEIQVFESGAVQNYWNYELDKSCLSIDEIAQYIGKGKSGHGLHISELEIYAKPRELSEFKKPCPSVDCFHCEFCIWSIGVSIDCGAFINRPPQSWCYVEEL